MVLLEKVLNLAKYFDKLAELMTKTGKITVPRQYKKFNDRTLYKYKGNKRDIQFATNSEGPGTQ